MMIVFTDTDPNLGDEERDQLVLLTGEEPFSLGWAMREFEAMILRSGDFVIGWGVTVDPVEREPVLVATLASNPDGDRLHLKVTVHE